MAKRGPKNTYDPKVHPLLIKYYAGQGLITKEIAEKIGIGCSTLFGWLKKYPELLESIKEGRDVPDAHVTRSLFQRAMGYEYEETEVVRTPRGDRLKRVKKRMAPDTLAIIIWLKNRRPDLWREKKEQPDQSAEILVRTISRKPDPIKPDAHPDSG